jgi:ribonuclease E
VARQMRLRDLGGLIVIDFIDMENPKHQREVETRLRDALHHDRARVQTGKISRFGLLEMSRQRLQPSLGETSYNPCPRCHGTGHIRGTESSALHILRILQEEAMKENTGALHVQLPVDVATFLLNEKRVDIHTLETRLKVTVMLIPNIHLETPNYSIARLRHDELNRSDAAEPSYKMATLPVSDEEAAAATALLPVARMEAAVKSIAPAQRVPMARPVALVAPQTGMFDRIFGWFKKTLADEPDSVPEPILEAKPRERSATRPERPRERKSPSARRPETREPREAKAPQEREPREPKEPRADRNNEAAKPPRTPRPPRPPRTEKPQEGEVRPTAETTDAIASTETREPRTRRGRGGRGRNREDRPLQDPASMPAAANSSTAQHSADQSLNTGVESVSVSNATAHADAHVQIAHAPVAAVVSPQRSFTLEPGITQSGNTPEAVLASRLASDKQLQQIETEAEIPTDSNDTPRGERPRRRRRPATVDVGSEPALQQVETAPVAVVSDTSSLPTAVTHPTRRRQRPQTAAANEPLIQVETGNPP